jgi:drug/metabolite transporter (DMT)-like permease
MARLLPILLISLILEAVGVVFLDKGLHEIGGVGKVSLPEVLRLVGRGFTSRYILAGLVFETMFFIGLLIMLSNWDVSLIWPLTSLGFVLTTLAAIFIRHETVTSLRWTGVLLIMIGATLVGWSEKRKEARPVKSDRAGELHLGKQ